MKLKVNVQIETINSQFDADRKLAELDHCLSTASRAIGDKPEMIQRAGEIAAMIHMALEKAGPISKGEALIAVYSVLDGMVQDHMRSLHPQGLSNARNTVN